MTCMSMLFGSVEGIIHDSEVLEIIRRHKPGVNHHPDSDPSVSADSAVWVKASIASCASMPVASGVVV